MRAHEAGPIRLAEVPAVQIDRVKGLWNKMWSSVAILLGLPAHAQRRHDVGQSGQDLRRHSLVTVFCRAALFSLGWIPGADLVPLLLL